MKNSQICCCCICSHSLSKYMSYNLFSFSSVCVCVCVCADVLVEGEGGLAVCMLLNHPLDVVYTIYIYIYTCTHRLWNEGNIRAGVKWKGGYHRASTSSLPKTHRPEMAATHLHPPLAHQLLLTTKTERKERWLKGRKAKGDRIYSAGGKKKKERKNSKFVFILPFSSCDTIKIIIFKFNTKLQTCFNSFKLSGWAFW